VKAAIWVPVYGLFVLWVVSVFPPANSSAVVAYAIAITLGLMTVVGLCLPAAEPEHDTAGEGQ